MRTGITVGKTHKGDWEIISSPNVPVHVQREDMRSQCLGVKSHDKFSQIIFQESDSAARVFNFALPEPVKSPTEPAPKKPAPKK